MNSGNGSRLTAVLGPTNTGKTHLAIERMLGHTTGMIGFPLRLLARENYEKVAAKIGTSFVALITGEEKIIPARARYFMCTVEAMPRDKKVEFLAIDEIQLASDYERGHIFTEKLLRARGSKETMFLGASTIKPLLKKVIPTAEFIARPRLSKLTYSGSKKITRLPRRSAIVVFSAQDVYGLAELVRQQKGGTAVVLGALSPRTRNAQVELYQNGEVDYLIATDAIGMGLNMNINHVAFADNSKFDGRIPRYLSAQELAQIAGRAGRHMNDGTFGVTGNCPGFEEETISAIEDHSFEAVRGIFWRNRDLSFDNIGSLKKSLEAPPPHPFFLRKRDSSDHTSLITIARNSELIKRVNSPQEVRLLWDVCQIPDFRKTLTGSHSQLLTDIYCHLSGKEGHLPTDWVNSQMSRFDRADGDIDTLLGRIAHIRTWTFITNKSNWIMDPIHWRQIARSIEDRLSDALHEKLTQRFVDRRATILFQKMRDSEDLLAGVSSNGVVTVEGHKVGTLRGLNFVADVSDKNNSKPVLAAVRKTLPHELTRRVNKIFMETDDNFSINDLGHIFWGESKLATIRRGRDPLTPSVNLDVSELIANEERKILSRRLDEWLSAYMMSVIPVLIRLKNTSFKGTSAGIVFQIIERLGNAPCSSLKDLIKTLTDSDKRDLSKSGLRFGIYTVFLSDLLKPKQIALLAILWKVFNEDKSLLELPTPGRVSLPKNDKIHEDLYSVLGFIDFGSQVIRFDIVERLAAILRKSSRNGPFSINAEMMSLVGLNHEGIAPVLAKLGYQQLKSTEGEIKFKRRNTKNKNKRQVKSNKLTDASYKITAKPRKTHKSYSEKADRPNPSPFSVLEQIKLAH
ncbi:MAG: helicase-related protein [Thalassobaculaceae bacterium]